MRTITEPKLVDLLVAAFGVTHVHESVHDYVITQSDGEQILVPRDVVLRCNVWPMIERAPSTADY